MATESLKLTRHPASRFNLGEEPWLTVRHKSGTVESVSLRDLFRQAHDIEDFVSVTPVQRYALQRYIIALGYMLYALRPDPRMWHDIVEKSQPIPADLLDILFDRMGPHWWLFHPDTPFMQTPALAEKAVQTGFDKLHPVATLTAHYPAKDNAAWWYADDTTFLTDQQLALALLSYHFGAPPGNLADVITSGFRRSEGGSLFAGPRDITHIFITGPTLLHTILGNLTKDLAAAISSEAQPAWELIEDYSSQKSLEATQDQLFLYTFTGAAVLVPFSEESHHTLVCRTPIPAPASFAKASTAAAVLRNPHVMKLPKKKDKPITQPKEASFAFFPPTATYFEQVWQLYKHDVPLELLQPTVLRPRDRLLRLAHVQCQTITLATAGNSSSPTFGNVSHSSFDPGPLLLPPTSAAIFQALMKVLAGTTKSVRSQLRYHIQEALSLERISKSSAASIADVATVDLWTCTESTLRDLILDLSDTAEVPTLDELLKKLRRPWIDAALGAYDAALKPFDVSAKTTAAIVQHRQALGGRLWNLIQI